MNMNVAPLFMLTMVVFGVSLCQAGQPVVAGDDKVYPGADVRTMKQHGSEDRIYRAMDALKSFGAAAKSALPALYETRKYYQENLGPGQLLDFPRWALNKFMKGLNEGIKVIEDAAETPKDLPSIADYIEKAPVEETKTPNTEHTSRWSSQKANRWYSKQAWPCGFNYVPANAISYTEMWMPYCFDVKLIDKELALAEGVGFNCLRVVLPFVVWEHDPAAFKKRLDTFVDICDKRGIKVMFTLFDDCAFSKLKDPWYGKQPEVIKGWYANGWTPSPGHSMVGDPNTWPRLEKYVKDIIATFKDDPRVWVWDLYNEPTNSGMGNTSLPLVIKVFAWARTIGPSQPLTVARWNGNKKLNTIIYENSDIITFHSYGNAGKVADIIKLLKSHNRPIINTEWLNRPGGSTPETCLPVFRKENAGCMHWGLVNGKTQTHLGWGWRPSRPEPKKWQHDLYRGDHTPYDKKELALFQKYILLSKTQKK